jgi:hypothetical protein
MNKNNNVIAVATLLTLATSIVMISGLPITPAAATTITNAPSSSSGFASNMGSNSTSSGLISDLNFSQFSEFNSSKSSDEFESSLFSSLMTDVNGTYTNPDIGFQIDLPTGWKGKEINFLINSVFAAPEDINLLEFEEEDFRDLPAIMTIVGIDEETFDMIEGFSELSALGGQEGGRVGEENASLQGSDRLETTTTPFGNNAFSCIFSQPTFVTINNITAEERLGECIDEEAGGGGNPKTKSYTFATQNNSLIIVGFYGNSTSTYDQNLPIFEESVKTINISRPADIATSQIYSKYKGLVESQLSNQTIT